MKRVRQVNGTVAMMRAPDTAIVTKKKVIILPRTEARIAVKAVEKMPVIMRKKQAA
jgi:hypothetical protein